MQMVKDISRNDIIRLVALGVIVLLEGLAVLSLILSRWRCLSCPLWLACSHIG